MSNTNSNTGNSGHNIISNIINAINHSSSSIMTTSGDGSSISGSSTNSANRQQPLLQGTLYKLHKKSGKKQKYFVIFDDAPGKPGTARLEYFDNEKKFRSLMAKSPDNGVTNQKRSITLCTCFNINRRVDVPKHKHVIGLYRKDDTFSIVMKDEKEMNEWLKQLLILQRGKELLDGDQPRPTFEHVWEVNVDGRGLGEKHGILGSYRFCITESTITLIRVGAPTMPTTGESRVETVEFLLANMRCCGSIQNFFFMEVGRLSTTGDGELWMDTFDAMIANNMSEIILHTAASKRGEGPHRPRASTTTDSTKSSSMRRSTAGGHLPYNESSSYATDSTESSATSTTSTGTVVHNFNALKPKNNQTHSVSQTSLQSTGVATAASAKHFAAHEGSDKAQLLQCSYANLMPNSSHKDQHNSATTNHVFSASPSSAICHQRTFSLPQNPNLNVINNQNAQSLEGNVIITNGANAIQPVHQRTRSLPLTEETAIDFSQSSPIFAKFLPSYGTSFAESTAYTKVGNNSMESIIEDYHSVDVSNNNAGRTNNGASSILKQLSKVANPNLGAHNSASSPSQLRKKRQHHNFMVSRSSQSSSRDRSESFSVPSVPRTRTNSDSSSNATTLHNGNFKSYNLYNNNTMMGPPTTIPMRPRTVYHTRSSPPHNSSPLSPPATSYSTESDGSSISIDETDFLHKMTPDDHIMYNNVGSMNARTTIPEENEKWSRYSNNNNNLPLPLNKQRKASPSSQSGGDYMEMGSNSPYSSSPIDANNYMPMSPSVDRGIYTSGSDAHSRASSLAEDNESYVPMHPSSTAETLMQMAQGADDYMNMQPASTSVSQTSTRGGDISSATSSCSITSGTPSTDIRFSEYHLDKVQARFTPCDDDDQLDRPPRTYSVGSKLEHSKRKHHIERVALEHSSRLRAYSVGSRNIKVTRAELTSHSGSHTPSHNSPTAVNHHEINNNSTSKNKKSSSVPMLSNHSGRAVHGSIDHMDDLMEIDYSKSSENSNSPNLTNGTPVKSSPMNIPSKNAEDYMNMSGRGSKPHTPSNASPYVDMRPGNRRISENIDNEYMDMAAPARNNSSSLSSSPLKATSAPQTVPLPQKSNNNSSYMDMSPRSYDGGVSSRKNRMTSSTSSFSSAKAPSDDYLNMSPVNKNLLEVGLPSRSSVPDGYMEMSWSKNKKADSKANDNPPSSSSDEYINMDFSNNNDGAGTSDSSSSAKERSPSMPITIQKRHSSSSRSQKSLKSGSVEGEPPTYLPLANPMTASISPTRSTNRVRCDSRDSGIVTPSSGSQATIFPFSPTSPNNFEERKVLVDGTSGSIKISESDTIEEEPRTPVPQGMLGANENNVENLSSDYAIMNIGEPVSKKPNLAATPVQIKSSPSSANSSHFSMNHESGNTNYMNCLPNASTKIVTPKAMTAVQQAAQNSQEVGDYALMNPLKTAKSPIQPQQQGSDEFPPTCAPKKSLFLTLSSQEKLNSNSCFKPIVEDESTNRSHPALHRQVSERGHAQNSNDSAYEMLARPSLSRPNSVNSEKVKQCYFSNRPSSALSSTSTSTSTLCEIQSQNSSSQTLRGIDTSAVPSPMSVTSRPESVSSDIHMASRPPSVTSERELHYASLDLPQCSSTNAFFAQPQRMEVDQKMDFSTSPSPQQTSSSSSSASSQQSQPAFTYAQIDFNAKSENTKAQQQHQNQSGTKK